MSIYAAILISVIQVVGCPETIKDKQVVTSSPSEWSVRFISDKHALSWVDVFNGPPEDMRALIGEVTKSGKTEWKFGGKENIWVDCNYSESAAVLRRNLGSVKRCAFVRPAQPSAAPPTFICVK